MVIGLWRRVLIRSRWHGKGRARLCFWIETELRTIRICLKGALGMTMVCSTIQVTLAIGAGVPSLNIQQTLQLV